MSEKLVELFEKNACFFTIYRFFRMLTFLHFTFIQKGIFKIG